MLRFMRKYAAGWFIKVLFGIIIIVFVLYFGSGTLKEKEPVVAFVGSHKVTVREYQESRNRLFNFYRSLYRDKFDESVVNQLKLKEKALDQIIDQYLLLDKAAELGLTVTDKEFDEYLLSIEAFKRDGKFDQGQFAAALKRAGVDPKQFEESEKTRMLTGKLLSIVRDNGVFLGDADLWQAYVKDKGKVNLAFAVFDPASFKATATVSDQEISSTYEKEKAAHRSESTYRLKQIIIDARSPVRDDVAYTDLIKMKDIDAYARDKGLQVNDLGTMKESEVLVRLKDLKPAEWLKGLKKGDISLPVRVGSGSQIFQMVDREEGRPLDKETAHKLIRERLVEQKAKESAKAAAEAAAAGKAADFKQETGYFARSSRVIPKAGPVPAEHSEVLGLSGQKPLYGKAVAIEDRYYVFSFKGEELPDRQAWEKEKDAYGKFVVSRTQGEYLTNFTKGLREKSKVTIEEKYL